LFKERYHPLPIGYSGHERDFIPTLAAVALGAKSVERHITLDKAMPGPDHGTVSITPDEFGAMVASARKIEQAFGSPRDGVLPEEMPTRDKHSKSIVSLCPIPAGTVVSARMLTCKSPGYGLKPRMLPSVIGKRVKADIPQDAVLTESHLIREA
jgi:sialic acid synthase SpsE